MQSPTEQITSKCISICVRIAKMDLKAVRLKCPSGKKIWHKNSLPRGRKPHHTCRNIKCLKRLCQPVQALECTQCCLFLLKMFLGLELLFSLFFFFFLKEEMKSQSMGCLGISPAPYVFPMALVHSPHSQCCTRCQIGQWGGMEVQKGWQRPWPPHKARQQACWLTGPCMSDASADRWSPVVPLHHEPPHDMTKCKNGSLFFCHKEHDLLAWCGREVQELGTVAMKHKLHPSSPSLILAQPLSWEVVG